MENIWTFTKDEWPEEEKLIDFELKGYALEGVRRGKDVDFSFWNPKYEMTVYLTVKMSQIEKWKYHVK